MAGRQTYVTIADPSDDELYKMRVDLATGRRETVSLPTGQAISFFGTKAKFEIDLTLYLETIWKQNE